MLLGEQFLSLDEGFVNTWFYRFLMILFDDCRFSFGRSVARK